MCLLGSRLHSFIMTVRFDCRECHEPWWSPPGNGCPRCGYGTPATPDPIVWEVGQIPGSDVFLTGQMRDSERFGDLVAAGFDSFVDVAGDAPYVWRPGSAAIRAAGVVYVRVRDVEDTNVDLPDRAFEAVSAALERRDEEGSRLLVFCAAGLKRAPHLLFGVLRRRGLPAREAWDAVVSARPFFEPFAPYVAAAERWAERASRTRTRRRSAARAGG